MSFSNMKTLAGIEFTETVSIIAGAATNKPIKLPDQWAATAWTEGTGDNQVNLGWCDARDYNTTGTTLDLTSLSAAATNTGAATFTAIKGLYVKNNDATNSIIIGNSGANDFDGMLAAGTDTMTIPPGGAILLVNPTAGGWSCTTGNQNLKLAASASTVNVTLALLGLD